MPADHRLVLPSLKQSFINYHCPVQAFVQMISAQSKDLKIFVGHGLFCSTTRNYRSGPMVGVVRLRLPTRLSETYSVVRIEGSLYFTNIIW